MFESLGFAARRVLLLIALVLVTSTGAESADRVDTSGVGARIVNGSFTSGYPAVGALLNGINPTSAGMACTGTMIGCETFITAAHCVCTGLGSSCQPPNAPSPTTRWVYLPNAGMFSVSEIVVHPNFDFPNADIAIVRLGAAVEGITPIAINTVQAPIPSPGVVVGYGRSGGGSSNADFGLKRFGSVNTTNCTIPDNTTLVCWDFLGAGSNTCNGDSGGPLFFDFGGGDVLGGITSGGASSTCFANDHSYDVNVATFSPWIQVLGGADLNNTSCGPGSHVGDANTAVQSASGDLGDAQVTATHEFIIVDGSGELRVAFNAIDDFFADFDMYVKHGSPPSTADFDCRQTSSGQFGYCEFSNPAGGRWYVRVDRFSGEGDYQVSVTNTDTTASTCGNGIIEPGEGCDGADDNECIGLCQLDCSCPPPVCGNDVQEVGEECDGTAAASCTGPCGDDCLCPCSSGDVNFQRYVITDNKVVLKAKLDNSSGEYSGVDPRDGFLTVLFDGETLIGFDLPDGSPGWQNSRPDKGRYKWKGELPSGLRAVRFVDRTSRDQTIKVLVKAKDVAGAANLVESATNVQFIVEQVCAAVGCGDAILDSSRGERCDGAGASPSCDADCSLVACGDGDVNSSAGEQCDDGDLFDGDGCDSNCTVTGCGNNIVTAGESCDDGGDSASCDANCTVAHCGDFYANAAAGEDCDEGGETATCDVDCTFVSCGDGTTNTTAGETCDDGGESATCDADCTSAVCGDSTVNVSAGEQCDPPDGGLTCNPDCTTP